MLEEFYAHVIARLKRMQYVKRLAAIHGDGFDQHIGYQVLDRGHRLYDTEYLALLYSYRYVPMHHAALRSVLPETSPDVLIDFGGGPGTAMLALSSNRGTTFERLPLKLTRPFVRALANRIAALSPSAMTLIYTNPVGPSASWMPRGDVHGWYKEFTKHLGHQSRILQKSYSYNVLSNLAEPVTRSGDCAYEVWKVR